MFLFVSYLFVVCSFFIHGAVGKLYYDDDGNVLFGDFLLLECASLAECRSHFSKNVYASSNAILDRKYTQLLFPEMYNQLDSDQACGTGSKFVTMGSCAQIHSPYTPEHPEGDLSVKYVEEQYTAKWDNIRNSETPVYDAILDNSVMYWSNDLSYHYEIWNEAGADIVFLKWKIKDTNNNVDSEQLGKTFYSIITHNGDAVTGSTLTQYEVISDTFTGITQEIEDKMITSEQRVYFYDELDYRELCSTCVTYAIGASRAVTDVDENVEWYLKIFSEIITDTNIQVIRDEFLNDDGYRIKYAHIKLDTSTKGSTVSFFQRNLDDIDEEYSTYGELKIADLNKGMTEAHNTFMLSPYCGIDRWFDMHMAVLLQDNYSSSKVLQTIMQSGEKYTVYNECGDKTTCVFSTQPLAVYMSEPNGHSFQLVFTPSDYVTFTTTPTEWDPDWCVMECTEEQLSYQFGDTIAAFDFGDESDDDEENYFNQLIAPSTNNNNNNNFMIVSGLLVFLLMGIVFVVYKNKTNTFKYESLPQ